ncbi:MAG TPA: beta-galactosidase [Vicinamibacterales bacterium]|nr:beta-galactosidase [Vicinamibacterales bacterium]
MRLALLPIALCVSIASQEAAVEPIVSIGIWYAGPGAQPPSTNTADAEVLRRDLAIVRRAGFNAVTTWVTWREAEPKRGAYALAGVERLIAAAVEADLKVSLVVFTDPPQWAGVAAQTKGEAEFLSYVTRRLGLQPGVTGIVRHTPAIDAAPSRIRVAPGTAPDARVAMWSAIAGGEKAVAFFGTDDPLGAVLSLGETAGVVTRNPALFFPLRPRAKGIVGITGNGPSVDVRLLESADALMIIGLNRAGSPRKATIQFSPDIPEAIWQNLETGTAVNFVMGKGGPFLDHTFGPRDAVVLMIRKKLR